ncbi:hypothetical protein I7I50_09640 [Histoplasma capsulatum G186AR]|nr:hypothetical protein I7I52_07170 [Histoplasma capsulatum]QSS74453.1 hypothetical protein I7I50_09640 [Histoplasma capsulatum G186AR]
MAFQSQSQNPVFPSSFPSQIQPAIYPVRGDMLPPPRSTYSDCSVCMTLKGLIDHERALQQHLDAFHRQANQDKMAVANYSQLCKDLKQSIADLECGRQSLKIALEKEQRIKSAMHSDLEVEKQKTSTAQRRCTSLYAENTTLWKFIEEMEVAPINSNHNLPTFRNLYFTNEELRKRLAVLQKNASTVVCDGDGDDDNDNDEDDDEDAATEIMEEDDQSSIEILS